MKDFLAFDTSNYTTSVAVYSEHKQDFFNCSRLLPVKAGERGIRQSDAVFHHTKAIAELLSKFNCSYDFSAVGASAFPRRREGSYMPCFCVGVSCAESAAFAKGIPFYKFSHQEGHIGAVIYSSGRYNLLSERFIAFHLSGGTTEMLLVEPDDENIFKVNIIGGTTDLNAGQVIDRIGVKLGIQFPCGKELEHLAEAANKHIPVKPSVRENYCSFSGLENKCEKLYMNGEAAENIAAFCFDEIICTVNKLLENAVLQYGELPVVFSGGVSSNIFLKKYFIKRYNAVFGEPDLSRDNALGIAFLTKLKYEKNGC